MSTTARGKIVAVTSCGGDTFGPTLPELVLARHLVGRNYVVPFVVQEEGRFTDTLRELGIETIVRRYAGHGRKVWRRATRALGTPALARRFADADCTVGFRLSSTPLALGLGRRLGVPVVSYLHSYSDRADKYVRYGVDRADTVIAVSQRTVDAYVRATEGKRSSAQKVELVLNGIDVEAFRAAGAEMDARAAFSIPRDVELVGMAGADPRKGTDVFVQASVRIAAERPDTHFLVAGRFRSESFRKGVVAEAESGGIASRVHWLGFQENIAAIMQACDVWAMPSRADAFPLAGLEAQAAGTPMVASAVGGVPEMVLDGETSFLVPKEDPAALAERVLTLLGDRDLRTRMGERGQSFISEKLSLKRQVEEFERCLQSLIRRKTPEKPAEA